MGGLDVQLFPVLGHSTVLVFYYKFPPFQVS